MAKKQTLIRQRDALKAQLARFETFVTSLTDDFDYALLATRLNVIKPLLDNFNQLQLAIRCCNEVNPAEEETECEAFESLYFKVISKSNQLLKRHPSDVESTPAAVDVPKFNGHIESWLYYKNSFVTLVHDNSSLSILQKFRYLRYSLQGPAAEVISDLDLFEANYSAAWDLLLEKYDHKQRIISHHVEAIFNLPTLEKENAVLLRQLYNGLTKHLRDLKYAGEPVEYWDIFICYLISNKLDHETRMKWVMEYTINEKEQETIDNLKKFLKETCEVLEAVGSKTRNKKCTYCDFNDHEIYNCDLFQELEVEAKIEVVRDKKLCANCLKQGHNTFNCRSRPCLKCNNKHHDLLHLGVVT